jgi:cytochrome c oxidase subunit 1
MTGRMYPEIWGRVSAVIIFIGFNLTFFPQFVMGYLGMPRRYYAYVPEFQVYHILSSAGASILAIGFVMPVVYLAYSLKYGERVGPNPWMASGLEWQTPSPPPTENFTYQPVITHEPYEFEHVEEIKAARKAEEIQLA